eukprot:c6307_g1_i1 orf=438-1166(+)
MKAMARIGMPCRLPPPCLLHTSTICLNKENTSSTSLSKSLASHQEMDFLKATDILFSEEEEHKRKKFGWDFHLWQAFVACLPSVAVYFTAQYARGEMKKMDAEREQKLSGKLKIEEKQQEEEARKSPLYRILENRLDKMEEKISKIESTTVQAEAAVKGEGQPGKVEKHEKNVKAGDTDTPVRGNSMISNARARESEPQNIPVKEELKEAIKDSVKVDGESKGGDNPRMPSKAESDDKGKGA